MANIQAEQILKLVLEEMTPPRAKIFMARLNQHLVDDPSQVRSVLNEVCDMLDTADSRYYGLIIEDTISESDRKT